MIIPIIHAASDLGQLQDPIDRVRAGVIGETASAESRVSVNAFWSSLRVGLEQWDCEFQKLLVFQDALPVGPPRADGIEHKIVTELAEKGSVNHQLIASLIQRGATLVGTEDPALLMREYELVKQFLNLRLNDDSQTDDQESAITRRQAELLVQRDQYIANRIDVTLVAPQVGLIFLGMLHRLEDHLPSDVRVRYPFGKPSIEQHDLFPN